MKKKIQDLIRGKIEYGDVHLLLPEENLEFSVVEDETYEGEFAVASSGEAVRGIVTCPNPRMSCLTPEFEGKRARIRFSYQTGYLAEGETDSGHFVITSSAGEYLLDFCAKITKEYEKTSIGRIKTLNDFTNLAKLNWEEALRVFQSPNFRNIFREGMEFERLLYEGLTYRERGMREMEEFLIGCGKKRRSTFGTDREERSYRIGREKVSDVLTVTRSEWGYFEALVASDADFVRPAKSRIHMYDFVGKRAEIPFEILPERMHPGKNFARITIENSFGKRQVSVTASIVGTGRKRTPQSDKRMLRWQLVQKFADYRSGAADKEVWSDESRELLLKIRELEPSNGWYPLFLVYVLWAGGHVEEAQQELAAFPKKQRAQRTPLSAFYQYLTTLGETDEDDIQDAARMIRETFAKYPEHPVLFWMLLQTDARLLQNPERRYEALRDFATEYSASPVFYLEAAKLLWKSPELLYRQGVFEDRIICWMAKKNLLNEALALRILDIALTKKQYEERFFRVLGKCHRILSGNMAVKSICSYLIKVNRYGESFFPWFQKGIEQHFKIAGLYEAYMMSWNRASGALPNEIIKYFSRNSSLPAKQKAMLFAYVVRNRERIGRDWDAYMDMVREFAARELEKGHMSEDLAIICEALKKQLPREEWRQIRGEAENCYKVHAAGSGIAALRVLQKESDTMQRVPVYQNVGYVFLYRRPFVILYEDLSGRLCSGKDTFRLRKMMSGEHIYAPQPKQKIPAKRREQQIRSRKEQLKEFAGSVREMDALIRQAEEDGLDVLEYREQLLIRMLFTGEMLRDHAELFAKIRKDPEAGKLKDAYVSWAAWRYLDQEEALSEEAAVYIGDACLAGRKLNPHCRAAFLKDYADHPRERYADAAEQTLREYLFAGEMYPFFAKLPPDMRRRYLLFGTGEDAKDWKGTRYGRMCVLTGGSPAKEELLEYARLCDLTDALFLPVRE